MAPLHQCNWPLAAICKTASHRDHPQSFSSLAGRGSFNNRLLVLKGQIVLNVVFAAIMKGLRPGRYRAYGFDHIFTAVQRYGKS